MTAPTRPVLRWHGGKWRLAPWIIAHFPRHRVYVEPFGGAANVLLRKSPALTEVYNDLDHQVVSLFRVLRDRQAGDRLLHELRATPFARLEFDVAFEPTDDVVEAARRLIVRSFFSGGTRGILEIDRANAGFNGGSSRSRSDSPQRSHAWDWSSFADALPAVRERMMSVVIDCRSAVDLMAQHDDVETLFYCDPPYLEGTRSNRARRAYRHEMDDVDHARLLKFLCDVAGMVVLSGYPSALYDEALPNWRRITTKAHADGARERTEVLWLNPACAAALDREHRAPVQLEAFGA